MRPLVAPEESRIGGTGTPRREFFRLPRRVWLTTAISAAACLTVIGLIAALSNQGTQQSVETAVYIGDSLPHVPAFFVDAGSTGIYHQKLRVISLTTGKVTSTEHAPAGTSDISFLAEQPQTGKYVAGFIGSRRGVALYRFRITGTGQLTKLMPAGRILPKEQPENVTPLALSPDGSHLAVSEVANGVPAPEGRFDAKIIVLDLRNGTRQVWDDGLTDRAHFPQITSAAWTPDGQALIFASHTCRLAQLNGCTWDFRKLARAGGRLRAGPVLLHQTGMNDETQEPTMSPDGGSVIEVQAAPGARSILVRVSLTTRHQKVLFRSAGILGTGPNVGNFEFIGRQVSRNKWRVAGWVDIDGFHPLRIPS